MVMAIDFAVGFAKGNCCKRLKLADDLVFHLSRNGDNWIFPAISLLESLCQC